MKKRLRKKRERRFFCLCVMSREWGGPEEGGWWYDLKTPLETVPYCRRRQALKRWKREIPSLNSGKDPNGRELSSVLNRGNYLTEILAQPMKVTRRPRYE